MAGKAFLLSLPVDLLVPSFNGCRHAVVFAETAADAKAVVKALAGAGLKDVWDHAGVVATELVAPDDALDAGLSMEVTIEGIGTFTYAAIAADVMDDIGDAMVALLNAHGSIASCTYTGATQVILIPLANALGDKEITARFLVGGIEVPGLAPTVNAEGASGIDRTITLVADSYALPKAYGLLGPFAA